MLILMAILAAPQVCQAIRYRRDGEAALTH
jgi:hypothetical protein